jgi:hypothetical protein
LKQPLVLASLQLATSRGRGSDDAKYVPGATVVATDQPTFSWPRVPGATEYTVSVLDLEDHEIARSERIKATQWKPDQPLPAGKALRWAVTSYSGYRGAASPPRGARFQVLEPEKAAELERARQSYAGSPLTLGVIYARAGLLDEAEAQLAQVVEKNQGSDVALKLLREIQSWRRASRGAGE